MKNIIISLVGRDNSALFAGIREFSTEKVILIASEKDEENAEKVQKDLKKFKIPSQTIKISGNLWEETFRVISEIKKPSDTEILINVNSGGDAANCAATSAAFVNGLKAFNVINNKIMMLPVLKFSYYKMIPDKKMEIIKLLYEDKTCCVSFNQLSKKMNMSLPLLSYHINGNLKSEGLKQMGLIETNEKKGRIEVKLTTLGNLLIKGYVN